MKIHFFGASVTAQSVNHATQEVTGYFPVIQNIFLRNNLFEEVERTAAGSSHFNGAGYCLLDEVLLGEPDIVVLEWHTTSLRAFDSDLWQSCIAKIIESGAICIVLILPRKDVAENWRQDACINQALSIRTAGYYVVNLYEEVGQSIDLDECLRDTCHTNAFGAITYADTIFKRISSIAERTNTKSPSHTRFAPHVNVSSLQLFEDYSPSESFGFKLLFQPGSELKSLIIDHLIGPFSPVCDIYSRNILLGQWCAWDPYCHYQRQTFASFPHKLFSHLHHDNPITVRISHQARPKYEQCRNASFSHEGFTADQLKVRAIYAVGNGVDISAIESSSRVA